MLKYNLVFCVFLISLSVESTPLLQCNNINTDIKPTTDHLKDNHDGTIVDSKTGLVWKKCAEHLSWDSSSNGCVSAPQPSNNYSQWPNLNWTDALKMASDVNAGNEGENFGATNWRVPDVKELFSIVELSCWGPTANLAVFPTVLANYYWTASPNYPDYNENDGYWNQAAWIVKFNSGGVAAYGKTSGLYVRLVRDL